MGKTIKIKAEEGHIFSAYRAAPRGTPKAGLVVLQEIFGVNAHIRAVTDEFAALGFVALAPALFDRVQRDADLGYDQLEAGRALMQKVAIDDVARDLRAAVAALRTELGQAGVASPTVGAVGYCWGGAIADLAACRTDVEAAVSYYGRANVQWLSEPVHCPVLYHFGEKDGLIPADVIEQIRQGRPGQPIYVYPGAGHGFNCTERPEFHPPSARLALDRTLAFFADNL